MKRGGTPSGAAAIGVVSLFGTLSALTFSGPEVLESGAVPILTGLVIIVGVLIGIALDLINFAVWRALGFLQCVHESDDAIYQRAREAASAMTAVQEGVWPPPTQKPEGDTTRL